MIIVADPFRLALIVFITQSFQAAFGTVCLACVILVQESIRQSGRVKDLRILLVVFIAQMMLFTAAVPWQVALETYEKKCVFAMEIWMESSLSGPCLRKLVFRYLGNGRFLVFLELTVMPGLMFSQQLVLDLKSIFIQGELSALAK